jgi:exodeoxyribonuclease V gamma subunit
LKQENYFHLEVSNSLNHLAAQLSFEISLQVKSVFQPVYIITQTEGMNSWLKLQIADNIGIAANIQFLKPNDLINKIYFFLGGSFSKSLSADDLNWLLYKTLGEKAFTKKYPDISSYYNYDGIDKDVKRMALAEKIADLFDQYQIYRPDMIEAWNLDKIFTKHKEEEWQKDLWMRSKELAGDIFPDKTLIGKFIINALKNPEQTERLQQKMPVIYLFGISVITEYHLQIFQNLAKHIEIRFLILNPAPYDYWYEDSSEKLLYFLKKTGRAHHSDTNTGNTLLTAWGKIIQDTFSILFKNDDLINSYEVIGENEPEPDSLLHKIQSSIFENKRLEKGTFKKEEITDGSITINSCYGPAREVEVLFNYLVHLIDKKNEKLSSRDIVVMVSDIDLYSSYIRAVFDNAPYQFKYTIADESYAATDSISNALHSILSITEMHFTAEEVVRLLDFSFIRKRFKITDTAQIRDVVDDANIRFGFEGNYEDDSVYVSWQYGLKRIMYGICISGAEEYGDGADSFFPVDNTESSGAFNVIRFVHFAEALIQSLHERKPVKTIAAWVAYIEKILNDFVCDKEDTNDEDYGAILGQLANYNVINSLFDEEISYDVFLHNFLPALTGVTRSKAFAGGGITFCSLIPMRSIPFKVVALLGMNFDEFPRKDKKLSFNLIEKERRKGDRNIKENDKHLFLETILSAQDYLYISYTGQSVKDNSSLPPSILIDELVDFIETFSEDSNMVRSQLITQQPLHSFSKKYDVDNDRYYSYLLSSKNTIDLVNNEKTGREFNFGEIGLYKLASFLKSPFKGYYNDVLGIYYSDNEVTLRDTEMFDVDTKEKWQLKNELLKNSGDKMEQFKNKKIKMGELPLKNMAGVVLENIEKEMRSVKKLFNETTEGKSESVYPVEIQFDGSILKGEVGNIFGNKQVAVSFSKNENKYLMEAWMNHLALRAAGYDIELYFISQNTDKVFGSARISTEEAFATLKELIKLYKQGHEEIIVFDPAFNTIPDEIDSLNSDSFNKILEKKFGKYGDSYDQYMIREFNTGFFDDETVVEKYQTAARKLFVPLATFFPGYVFKKVKNK